MPDALTKLDLSQIVQRDGFTFMPADGMHALLQAAGSLGDWDLFAESWEDLAVDTYMADQGRYRKRRYAVYSAAGEHIKREKHQPHFQTLDYNPLHGGIERWFEAIKPEIGVSQSLQTILKFCCRLFGELASHNTWHIETHQFRIEAKAGEHGQPTPEGLHRDGRDYVLVLLIHRENIQSGVTSIHDLNKKPLGSFTLTYPFDAALVDDNRVYHGVTAVTPVDPTQPAYRDVLVVTFKAV